MSGRNLRRSRMFYETRVWLHLQLGWTPRAWFDIAFPAGPA